MTASALPLTPIHPDELAVVTNTHDLRRDVHTYVRYVKGRRIKRSVRGNELPAADYKRLAQVIADDGPGDTSGFDHIIFSHAAEAYSWIYYVEDLANDLGFVHFDTKGKYRGYNSAEPSFPDNFVEFNVDAYRDFLALPLAEQERRLFDTLVDSWGSGENEFYRVSVLGRLDRFSNWGSATGVMRALHFGAIRRFLFDLLQGCEPGAWYRTAELVAYLKARHPHFLIPEKVESGAKRKTAEKRYGNFHEDGIFFGASPVPDDAPDGFERVEGRYVERFLEGIPLTLGYVEVAYGQRPQSPDKLSRGVLQAFRVTERFAQAMRGTMPPPRVVVQPNFEIYIESPFYPAHLIDRLAPLTDVIREDTTTILKLHKQKVAAQLAENAGLDVIALLKHLTGQELPQNVAVELREWAGHADVFTLYDGFGLLESADHYAAADAATVERIGASLRLVRDPEALFARLTQSGAIAIRARHGDAALEALPEKARTVFPRKTAAPRVSAKPVQQTATVKREMLIALHFPDDDLFDVFRKALLDARCVLDVDREKRALTIAANDEAQVKRVAKHLAGAYAIRFEDLA